MGNRVSLPRVILSIYNLYFKTCHPIFEEKWEEVIVAMVNISVQSHYSVSQLMRSPLLN